MSAKFKSFISDLLSQIDIQIGGSRPWDIQVHDDRLYNRVMTQGSLGLGEAYMDGWWDAGAVDQFLYRVLTGELQKRIKFDFALALLTIKGVLLNPQRLNVREVGEKHYDIGNDLYKRMLDPRMIYSCGYWREAETLEEAQEAKLDLICRKIGLKEGMRILDIGSGWGGLLKFAAEKYGVSGVGITVSKEQMALANDIRGNLPIETRLMDYMELDGQFDRIVSVGMFEHVGYKNYNAYFSKVHELLPDDGLFLLHSIGGSLTRRVGDPWLEKYVFPNGMLPSPKQVTSAVEGKLIMEDWHNFGADYDRTLMAWHERFEAAWPELKDKYGERFYRMWRYYLLLCAAVFRARWVHLWQIVYSKNGLQGGYLSVR
ncbi:cyclopropane fatty acyl phospholipid synthase [Pelagibacterium sp. 26DY04]|uniref:cyclopropane fatty acyl phospholipid synthase n=1 Tax=unclassified Pelagibacterium TaxID=2623280 RepID=UPI0028169C72|nr:MULTISPECIES: cyclopropane fatty acyl phospholipid synthase [unclassified Pelagibacterium]WMT88104.1 cyclopropane fatty acyl phospholipid synthase [Pelagibacterium sp. 26DY04]WMT91129.1 cyclopropane fatty acyl phospholipid synthase [Pelagibacterium sp. H642]